MKRLIVNLVCWSLDFSHGSVVKLAQPFQTAEYTVNISYFPLPPAWSSLWEFQKFKKIL